MDNERMKNRLQLADETIAILRSSNIHLDKNLAALKSDFSVLESLLIESGQTLQRLQEMYHKEKEANNVLTTALSKADIKTQELTDLLTVEVNKNKDLMNHNYIEQIPLQIAEKKDSSNELALRFEASSPPALKNGHGQQTQSKMHMYHISIRDSLRDMAESLCDELVRVEEDMLALEPLLRMGQQEVIESQSSSSSSKYNTRARNNRLKRNAGPDFLFGSPSSRLPVNSSEGIVDEEEGEDGEEDSTGSEEGGEDTEGESEQEEGEDEEGVDEEKTEGEEYEEGEGIYNYDGNSEDDEGEYEQEGEGGEYAGEEGEYEDGGGGEEGEEGDDEYQELQEEEGEEYEGEGGGEGEEQEQGEEGEGEGIEDENQEYEDIDINDEEEEVEEVVETKVKAPYRNRTRSL